MKRNKNDMFSFLKQLIHVHFVNWGHNSQIKAYYNYIQVKAAKALFVTEIIQDLNKIYLLGDVLTH